MFAFWSSLTLRAGRYHGQPMAKHMPLAIDAHHFDRWLALFEQRRATFARPPPLSDSSSGLGGSRRVSSLGSRAQTETC
jgi:hemoglobin